jgi:hypothetical protein
MIVSAVLIKIYRQTVQTLIYDFVYSFNFTFYIAKNPNNYKSSFEIDIGSVGPVINVIAAGDSE